MVSLPIISMATAKAFPSRRLQVKQTQQLADLLIYFDTDLPASVFLMQSSMLLNVISPSQPLQPLHDCNVKRVMS